MILVALAFIAFGYPLGYWGANQIKHWDRSVQTTKAAPLSLLFGVASAQSLRQADKLPIHPVPFPYKTPNSGGVQPSSTPGTPNGKSNGSGGGAQLSPKYPGGSPTIPSPSIPGGQSI